MLALLGLLWLCVALSLLVCCLIASSAAGLALELGADTVHQSMSSP